MLMTEHLLQEFSKDVNMSLDALTLIKENKYCLICRAETAGKLCIIKQYKGDDPFLVREEARALNFYNRMADGNSDLMGAGEVVLKEDENLLCTGYVPGRPLNEILYQARWKPSEKTPALKVMGILGKVIRNMHELTREPGTRTSAFIFEYLSYCSNRLEKIPLLGRTVFKGAFTEARALARTIERFNVTPSFVHGDFVFKNIHVNGERVGLIDFANSNWYSHPLNDIYSLRFALMNMILPAAFRKELWSAFRSGLGDLPFALVLHRFYFEYHRRRWLMLKLTANHPLERLQGLRGLLTFARPFSPKAVAL